MYKIIITLSILAIGNGQVINQCTRNPGVLPLTTVVEGCTNPPCSLLRGRPLNIHISFRAPRPLNNMLTLVTAYLNLGNAVMPNHVNLGADANTCNVLSNRRCPVPQGELVNFTLRMNITAIPMMQIIPFEIRVVDHGPMACVMVPIRAVG